MNNIISQFTYFFVNTAYNDHIKEAASAKKSPKGFILISEPLKLIRHIPVIAVKNPIKNSFPGFSLPFIKKYVERATKKVLWKLLLLHLLQEYKSMQYFQGDNIK